MQIGYACSSRFFAARSRGDSLGICSVPLETFFHRSPKCDGGMSRLIRSLPRAALLFSSLCSRSCSCLRTTVPCTVMQQIILAISAIFSSQKVQPATARSRISRSCTQLVRLPSDFISLNAAASCPFRKETARLRGSASAPKWRKPTGRLKSRRWKV